MESIQHLLGARKAGFQYIWNLLKKNNVELIVETGTSRIPDNWEGDGQSTRIWDMYLKDRGNGKCYSIDICEYSCEVAKEMCSDNCNIVCSDSIKWLSEFQDTNKIGFLYLDSHDIDWSNPHPASLHHLMELTACFAQLSPKCIIAVDDNRPESGKGKYVREFLEKIGYKCILDDYQIVMCKGDGNIVV